MKKLFGVSLILFGFAGIIVPLLAAYGHIDLLLLGDPALPATAPVLRDAGGQGNVTWTGTALMMAGMITFLVGAFKSAVAFPGN